MFSTLSTGLTHTASMRSVEEGHVYLKQRFTEFLDTLHRGSINYHKVIEELLQRGEHRLGIDLNALRQFDPDLALGWVAKYIYRSRKRKAS